MGYLNGLNKFLAAPELVIQLFELVRAKLVTIARQAVELLFVLCNYDGWNLVYNAATTFYSSRSELPFQDIILMLDQNDLDTRVSSTSPSISFFTFYLVCMPHLRFIVKNHGQGGDDGNQPPQPPL